MMFASLSFKKFQRRIRSPFTFLKKLAKKQRKNNKRQASKQPDNQDQVGSEETPAQDSFAVPAPNVKIAPTSNTDVTSATDSGVFFPPTPKSLSSESGPTARVQTFERALPEIIDEVGQDVSAPAEVKALALSGEKPVTAGKSPEVVSDTEGSKADPNNVEDATPIERAAVAIDIEVVAKDQEKVAAVSAKPVSVENAALDITPTSENTNVKVDDIILPSEDEVAAKKPEVTAPLPTEPEPVAQVIEQVNAIDVDVTLANVDEAVATEQTPTPVDSFVKTETISQVTEPDTQEVKAEEKLKDSQLVRSPVPEISVQQLHVATTKGEDVRRPVSILKFPQTPRSATLPKVVTPPITPRKRVTSEGQTKKDKDIIDELQASVRSREKKRKEQEMMQAAERERKQRELSVKLEKELEKTDDCDEVLREVRSWRKRRESSLIKAPDTTAKDAAYREAFASEEIMLELQSAVQSRSARGPYVEDPAEKRQQLLLEELYARRVPAMQA